MAQASAVELSGAAGRRSSIPVRKRYVEAMTAGRTSPLVKLYRGGRSGSVAIKFHLALLWRCAGGDFSTTAPARNWATLLALPDPEGKGTRRISAATLKLEALKLIEVEDRPGRPNKITILNE